MIFKSVKAWMEGWRLIRTIPRWVDKAYDRWNVKRGVRPYNKTKHFVGKTFIYRVRHGMGMQGEAPIIGWYRKKRFK